MAKRAVIEQGMPIKWACQALSISETCYRYEAKLNIENEEIADWLIRLTDNNRTWGFGLCYLYLHNIKNVGWNHKRIYRIYKALELNLRIKPRKRLVREKPEPLSVSMQTNQVWSMDFIHDQLQDGKSFRLFNLIDDFNREALAIEIPFTKDVPWKAVNLLTDTYGPVIRGQTHNCRINVFTPSIALAL